MGSSLRTYYWYTQVAPPRHQTRRSMTITRLSLLTIAMLSVLAAALVAAPPARAHAAAGHVETDLAMPSPLLGREIPYALYLPPGAGTTEALRALPVLYLLHGVSDTHKTWLNSGQIAGTLDRLIARGAIAPMAVVMPGAGDSWYADDARSPRGFGPVASALLTDFIPGVEQRHHLAACRTTRAIGGLSMGGYGAVALALTRPELFTASISLSGSLFSDRKGDIERNQPFYTDMMGGIFGEPFDPERFRKWTVFAKLEVAPPAINDVGFWLAAGDFDFNGIIDGTVRMHRELRRRNIQTHLRVYEGSHDWALWSMAIEPALLWLAPRLKPCDGAP